MKKIVFFLLCLFPALVAAQECIRFTAPEGSLREISRMVSIDNVQGRVVTAYVNQKELQAFETLGIAYTKVVLPQPKAVNMANSVEELKAWNKYPTYETYVEFMQQAAQQFPEICRLDTIGTSVQDRLILCMRIHPQQAVSDSAPEFFYSSTIHGDEVTGYYFMLRLIDTLLNGYANNAEIKQLVDWVDIYINPLSNPDGTYKRGNHTVEGAQRYNANYVDLNRNYPDPFGSDPYEAQQKENTCMIEYFNLHHFRVSANLHGGAEVLNYPWDSYTSRQQQHPEAPWWREVCRRFIDTVRSFSQGHFNDVTSLGYITGGDWYVIPNGRQDYVNYEHDCLEMTMEISSTKTLSSTSLRTYWNFQHRSLINYIKETLRFGPRPWTDPTVDTTHRIRDVGVEITVNREGEDEPYPIAGTCFTYTITNNGEEEMHVNFNAYIKESGYTSWIGYPEIDLSPGESWSDQMCGNDDPALLPVLLAGANTLVVVLNVDDDILSNNRAEKTIHCVNTTTAVEASSPLKISLYPNPARDEITIQSTTGDAIQQVEILDASGRLLHTASPAKTERFTYNVSALNPGIYLARITTTCGTKTLKFSVR